MLTGQEYIEQRDLHWLKYLAITGNVATDLSQ